jgi:hypothetical protein
MSRCAYLLVVNDNNLRDRVYLSVSVSVLMFSACATAHNSAILRTRVFGPFRIASEYNSRNLEYLSKVDASEDEYRAFVLQ